MSDIDIKNNSSISVVILYGSEPAKILDDCRRHLKFADEIIVVDTKKIKGSFSEWRNEGIGRASGKWVLYVDTDEEVTNNLSEEVVAIANSSDSLSAYALPRRNFIFGKEFKHGGQWPDYQKRLFRKTDFVKWEGNLHEEPRYKGEMGYLNNPLIHHKNITISQMLDKTNNWSEIEAKLLFDANHPPMNFFRFASAAIREFYLRFVRQLSFLDGTEGVIYGIYQIYSRLITYSKLWEMQLKQK